MALSAPLSEDDLHSLYAWVDEIPLSRPKRNISRDFSDGVCVAEIVKHFFPRLVELHNYVGASCVGQKIDNWGTLNAKVFRKLSFEVPLEEVRDITSAVPGAIERFLRALQTKIIQVKQKQAAAAAAAAGGSAAGSRPSSAAFPRGGSPHSGGGGGGLGGGGGGAAALLEEKDRAIQELRESVSILSEKVSRLEELVRVKDNKILAYQQRLSQQQQPPPSHHHGGR